MFLYNQLQKLQQNIQLSDYPNSNKGNEQGDLTEATVKPRRNVNYDMQ